MANRARSVGGQRWLNDLPELVAELCAEWGLTLDGPSFQEGTEAFVTPVVSAEFGPTVLKILVPRRPGATIDTADHEVTVLRLANGEGCATLYRADVERRAMVIERLGPSLFARSLPLDERHRVHCRTAARIWRPLPATVTLPTGAEKAEWLIGYISTKWEELGRPCRIKAVEYAIECATRRRDKHDPGTATLVHGDVNDWNVLQTLDGSDHKLIDPDGLVADPEYDLGVIMREDPLELMAEADPMDRARRLADWAGQHTSRPLDPIKVWEWGVVERVSTGLMAVEIDLQPIGDRMLAAADHVVP